MVCLRNGDILAKGKRMDEVIFEGLSFLKPNIDRRDVFFVL